MRLIPLRILSTALLALGAVAAHALVLTFDSPLKSGSVGQTIDFNGTLVNDGAPGLFIASDVITQDFLAPGDWLGLTLDDSFLNDFLVTYPGLFPSGATYRGRLFSVLIGPTATSRLNAGNFALIDDQGVNLANGNFALSVQAVPEPLPLAVLLSGVLLLRRRR